jgi:hypothetical protein
LRAEYDTDDPGQLADVLDVSISRDSWVGIDGVRLLGTYNDDEITLYTEQIRIRASERGVEVESLEREVVIHELGHHVFSDRSFGGETPTGFVPRIVSQLGLPKSGARSLEEHAVVAFTNTLTDSGEDGGLRRHRESTNANCL